jgi:hypothetical protein
MDQQISSTLKERDGAPLKCQDDLASFSQKQLEGRFAPLLWSPVS